MWARGYCGALSGFSGGDGTPGCGGQAADRTSEAGGHVGHGRWQGLPAEELGTRRGWPAGAVLAGESEETLGQPAGSLLEPTGPSPRPAGRWRRPEAVPPRGHGAPSFLRAFHQGHGAAPRRPRRRKEASPDLGRGGGVAGVDDRGPLGAAAGPQRPQLPPGPPAKLWAGRAPHRWSVVPVLGARPEKTVTTGRTPPGAVPMG